MLNHIYSEIACLSKQTNLIIVTKTRDPETILPFLQKGHLIFGESKVQEAQSKWKPLKETFKGVELHMIGTLQSNKVKEAIGLFNWIHTLDRFSLAKTLYDFMQKGYSIPNLLIQVNIAGEPQKGGILPQNLQEFMNICIHEYKLPVKGFMIIPPLNCEPSLYFYLIKKMAKQYALPITSMGMSQDYTIALKFQPSYIRLGSILFNEKLSHVSHLEQSDDAISPDT